MKQEEIYAKAMRLLEGGVVTLDGLQVRMVQLMGFGYACDECQMDSLCRYGETEICNMCMYLELFTYKNYILKLVSEK